MKNTSTIFTGLIITVAIACFSNLIGHSIHPGADFFPGSFGTHTLMLLLSIIVIIALKKYVNFRISMPKLKTILKPAIFGFLAAVITNAIMMSILFGL